MSYKIREKLELNNLLSAWKKIANQYDVAWKDSFLQWELPKNIEADFSLTLALPIACKIKQNPQKVAEEITKIANCHNLKYDITEQGYINFCFPITHYQQFLWQTFQENGKNLKGEKKSIRLNLEYVSANPTGYLHLAHFRQAFVGNTLANVYQFLGYEVTREYYINDRGEQTNDLVNSIYYFYHALQNIRLNNSEQISYPGKSSQETAQILIGKWGNKYVNKELDEKEFNIWKKTILELILSKIRQDLKKCGVEFDRWFSETSLYTKNEHLALLAQLKEKDLIYSQEGATFFRSSLGNDEKDRVIIKKDNEYTYFFSDILYHQDKLQRSDLLIDIWGADHHGYIERIKSSCQLLGYNSSRIEIMLIQIANLLTKDGNAQRFSKRLGNTIELEEALEYMDLDQLKFFLLEKDPNQPLSINTELLKENKEKTRLYYIQYAHARCHQIFQKAKEKALNIISANVDLLKEASERKIFNLLIRFSFVLNKVIEENKPHHLIHYLYDLSQVWQVYYQNSVILVPDKLELVSQKLLLVKNIQIILKTGLNLLGIEAPNIM